MGCKVEELERRVEKQVAKYEFSESTKIRDLKFNPFRPWQLAVQSSTKLQLLDMRKGLEVTGAYEIVSNELHGIGVKWDPGSAHRIASAISREISIFDVSSGEFEEVEKLSHYSLIKSFHWMRTRPSCFGIMCDKPEKNIVFYDLEDKNRLAYYYCGHQKPMDCWIMNEQETILISVSNHKEKKATTNSNYVYLVAQFTQNFFDPNEHKFNYPVSFNNDSEIGFCLNEEAVGAKKSSAFEARKKGRAQQRPPCIYRFRDTIDWLDNQPADRPLTFKEEVLYLARNYLLEGTHEQIQQHNSAVAARLGKYYCAEVWKHLFSLCFPEDEHRPSMDYIFERKLEVSSSILDNRVILRGGEQGRPVHRIDPTSLLQWLLDEYSQLQTVALAAVCLLGQAPECVSGEFVDRVWNPYIDLLRSLQLYEIAAESILMTKSEAYMQSTRNDTTYNVTCGSCRQSLSKRDSKCNCNLLCVLCEERLNKKMVIWCKYCGHGGHAAEYEKWFQIDRKKYCPHGCGHACFTPDPL